MCKCKHVHLVDLVDNLDKVVFYKIPIGVSCTYSITCLVLTTTQYIVIRTNNNVLNMFAMLAGCNVVYLDISNLVIVNSILPSMALNIMSADKEHPFVLQTEAHRTTTWNELLSKA